MPDAVFFTQVASAMKLDARMLLAEPAGQVSEAEFDTELEMAIYEGLEVEARPPIRRTRTAAFAKDSKLKAPKPR
jgi:hypothetical protein